jgi:hypothetical protein
MANKNYLHIDPVGQLDPFACWAACLKWWLKAKRSISKSQRSIINKYEYLTNSDGTMTYDGIEWIIVDNNMYIENHARASTFTSDAVKKLLKFGPIFTAYTETSLQMSHVNVIYGITGSGNSAQVSVMEPQAVQKSDWSYKGKHLKKSLSEFNQLGEVILGHG